MSKKIVLVLGLASILLATLLSGCTEQDTVSYDDEDFKGWLSNVIDLIVYDAQNAQNCISSYDYDCLSNLGVLVQDHAEQYMNEINMFHVSPEMQEIKDETFSMLQDYKWMGFNMEYYDLNDADQYATQVADHISTIKYLLEQIS